MILFIDESGSRRFNDDDDLMEFLSNTGTAINFVMADGQGTIVGAGSDSKSLMKSMLLTRVLSETNPLMKAMPTRKAVAPASTKLKAMQKSHGDYERIFAKIDELIVDRLPNKQVRFVNSID
jgi:hypothetical protein